MIADSLIVLLLLGGAAMLPLRRWGHLDLSIGVLSLTGLSRLWGTPLLAAPLLLLVGSALSLAWRKRDGGLVADAGSLSLALGGALWHPATAVGWCATGLALMGVRCVWATQSDWVVRLATTGLATLLTGMLWATTGWIQALLVLILIGGGALAAYVQHTLFHANDLTVARSLDQMMASYVQELDALYGRVRGWRHDYHDHLQVLKATLGQGQVASAQAYLATLEDKLTDVDTIVHSGDRLVDAVINAKLTIAERLGIPTDVSVFVGDRPLRDEVDMVVILGNLLDNAIEAIEAQPAGETRSLRIYITLTQQQLYLSVTNSMADAQAIDPAFASTKNDRRGLGLRRVNALVAKYHGMINRQYETGVFATEILLPLATITQ